jgi:PKD repeat protein
MAREATSTELTKLRSKQRSIPYILIYNPPTVYSCQVAQSIFSAPVMQVTIDNATGTLSDVKPGMLCYVGSTAGAYDKGMVRIRKTPLSGILYIGETSEIAWEDNLHLTVVRDFPIWQRPLIVDGSTVYMDFDIPYTDQHNDLDPVPVLGSDRVIMLSSREITADFDFSGSWVLGSTISSYFTAVSGAGTAVIDDATSATPTITFDTAGWYMVACTVTAANGKSGTGYRLVHVLAEGVYPEEAFTLEGPIRLDADVGGGQFSVRMYAGAAIADIRERAKVILFTRDWYGDDEGSIGPLAGSENILASGWIAKEAINWDPEDNYVTFEVQGPQYWLNQQKSYPLGLEYSDSADAWTSMDYLTVDRGLWHFLHWRSTATLSIDIQLTSDTQYAPTIEAPNAKLWEQIKAIASETILAEPRCDLYGRLFVEIDLQVTPENDRTSIPTVMELTQDDISDEVYIERVTVNPVTQTEASGVAFDGTNSAPLSSVAPGTSYGHYGDAAVYDYLVVSDQNRLNELSGQLYARDNNEFPAADFQVAANNRLIGVCPRQRVTVSIVEDDTVRGIVWTNKAMIPRRIEYSYDNDGFITMAMSCEGETTGTDGVTVYLDTDTPVSAVPEGAYGIGDILYPLLPTGRIWTPDFLSGGDGPPSSGCRDNLSAPFLGPYTLWPQKFTLNTQDSSELSTMIFNPCMVRSIEASNKTYVRIHGVMEYLSAGVWTRSYNPGGWLFEAVDGDQAVIFTAKNEALDIGLTSHLEPAAQLDVNGFKLSLVEPMAISSAIDHTFDFSNGTQGWVWTGTGDGEGRWANARIEKSGGIVNWRYYPDELYVASGAYMAASHYNNYPYCAFTSMGIDVVLSEEPLTIAYRYINIRGYSNPIYNISVSDIGKRVYSFHWYTDSSGETWEWLDNVHVYGFISNITARRLTIGKIEIFNVCGYGG